MIYNKCGKCGTYHFDNKRCPDEYTIYEEEYLGEDGKKMRGYSFEDVAENYASYRNDEGRLIDDSITVIIEDRNGKKKIFELSAEITVQFNVSERAKGDF